MTAQSPLHRQYKHVIFDFDGVLCDSLEPAIAEINGIRTEHYPHLPAVSGRDDMAHFYAGSLSTCLHRWLSEAEAKMFFDLHSAAMARIHHSLQTFPGIGDVLKRRPRGGVSIVTSAYSDAVRAVLSKDSTVDVSSIFRIAGRELRQKKSEKIAHILSSLGLKPQEALYVGDLESDILYCRDVPIDIVVVGYGYHPAHHLKQLNPEYCVDSVNELGTLLDQITLTNP